MGNQFILEINNEPLVFREDKGIFSLLERPLNKEELKELLAFISITLGRLNRQLGVEEIKGNKEGDIKENNLISIDKYNVLVRENERALRNVNYLTEKLINLEIELNRIENDLVDEVKRKMKLKEENEGLLADIANLKRELNKYNSFVT
jgi:hypothetical protein